MRSLLECIFRIRPEHVASTVLIHQTGNPKPASRQDECRPSEITCRSMAAPAGKENAPVVMSMPGKGAALGRFLMPPDMKTGYRLRDKGVRIQGVSVRATRKPTWRPPPGKCLPRDAERRVLGWLFQEPPRVTRFSQSPCVHAEPSVGAPW